MLLVFDKTLFELAGGVQKQIEHCSECTLKIVDGMTENPEEDGDNENYICESTCARESDTSYFYSFKGDAESFFSDIFESGTVKINVPEYARFDHSAIDLSSLSIEDDISVDERRKLGNSHKRKGTKRVLVVLVKDSYGNTPDQSASQISKAIFGGDGNGVNMVSFCILPAVTLII